MRLPWTRTMGAISSMVRMNLLRNISLEKTRPCDTFGKLLPTTGNLERVPVDGLPVFRWQLTFRCGLINLAVLIHRFSARSRICCRYPSRQHRRFLWECNAARATASADRHEPNSDGDSGPARLWLLGHLQADWPADLERAGENEVYPTHLSFSYLCMVMVKRRLRSDDCNSLRQLQYAIVQLAGQRTGCGS